MKKNNNYYYIGILYLDGRDIGWHVASGMHLNAKDNKLRDALNKDGVLDTTEINYYEHDDDVAVAKWRAHYEASLLMRYWTTGFQRAKSKLGQKRRTRAAVADAIRKTRAAWPEGACEFVSPDKRGPRELPPRSI